MIDHKELMRQGQELIAVNLAECCREELEWQNTALLCNGKMREAGAIYSQVDSSHALSIVQSEVARQAMQVVAAAPQVVADERKPFAFVIVDKDRNPEFVTPDWDSAQEHINDACEMSIENDGKWKAIPAFEMRPTDDKLWDETMKDRDQYHEWADKLAGAISLHFGADIGEHSNMNCPWAEALEIIEQAAPVQAQEPVLFFKQKCSAIWIETNSIAWLEKAAPELKDVFETRTLYRAPVQPVAVP